MGFFVINTFIHTTKAQIQTRTVPSTYKEMHRTLPNSWTMYIRVITVVTQTQINHFPGKSTVLQKTCQSKAVKKSMCQKSFGKIRIVELSSVASSLFKGRIKSMNLMV